jgi:AcrR family transcriptional regulator
MSGKAEYKSAIRSRNLIRHAFVELVLEKGTEKVTVKSIVERAEISRGTFYAHYSDIYAVIEEIENETMGQMIELLNAYSDIDLIRNPKPFLHQIAQFYEQDLEFYRMLINTGRASTFITKLKEVLIEKILGYKKTIQSGQECAEFTLRVHFVVNGFVSLYQDWFEEKVDGSLEELSESIGDFMIQGFQSYIR